MRLAFLALAFAVTFPPTGTAQNCDGDAQSRAVCIQQQGYERGKQEFARWESERRQAAIRRYDGGDQPPPLVDLAPPPAEAPLSPREMARQLAALFNDLVVSNPQELGDEVVSGIAEAVEEGVLLVLYVNQRDPTEFRSYVETERRSSEDELCGAGPRDFLNVGGWLSLTYQPSGGFDSTGHPLSTSFSISKEVCDTREAAARQAMEEARRAQDQQAADAAGRAAAIREAAAARAAAEQRAAEERQAQEQLAAEQRREAETWHAIMTPARLKAWMTLEDERRSSWLWKDSYRFYDLQIAVLALVSAEIAADAESRDLALRWIADGRRTSLPDLDELKLWPTKNDAEVLADARQILQTTEISDDRLTSRVATALSEESRLWQLQRREAMCNGLVDAAIRYGEDRDGLVKRVLASTCVRYDVDRSIAFLKQVAAAIPDAEIVDFWQRVQQQLSGTARFALLDAVGAELSNARGAPN